LRALHDKKFGPAAELAVSATRPAEGFWRLNPARWLARRKLRKLLLDIGLPHDQVGMESFAAAARLGSEVRPLRHRIEAASTAMFGKMADSGIAPARLSALARDLHAVLERIQHIVEAINKCPEATELERAASIGTPEAIMEFLDRVSRSLRSFDARMA